MSFYPFLFQLSSLAIIGWFALIVFPTWRGSRRLAASGFFPIYISVFYAFGIGALLMERGTGFVADFGTAEGVARLLAQEEIAWVAWLHILAFDQVVGLMIYRENMRHRYVPIPAQSALLFLALLFGPLGYLTFALIRVGRLGSRAFAVEPEPGSAAPGMYLNGPAVDVADPVSMDRRVARDDVRVPTLMQIGDVYREERAVTLTALGGVVIGGLLLAVAFVRGADIPPEGDLLKPATFNLAVGIFILSLIPWLPAAGFTRTARRLWSRWMAGLLIYAFGVETIQQLRGIDPRFSQAEPESQIFGALFFASAMGITVLSIGLGARAFETRAAGRGGLLVVAARWAGASMLIGFLSGMWLSANQGRFVGDAGNLLPLHAAGFHAVQAVPLVALMLAWSSMSTADARRWVHTAGAAWLGACLAIWWQTAHGRAVTDPAEGGLMIAMLLGIWTLAAVRGLLAWRLRPST